MQKPESLRSCFFFILRVLGSLLKSTMPGKTCVVQFCNNTAKTGQSIHHFPKDPPTRRLWVQFVQTKRANFSTPSGTSQLVICSDHFAPDCFERPVMFNMGFRTYKKLKPGSVPTIHAVAPNKTEIRKRPSSSKVLHKMEVKRVRNFVDHNKNKLLLILRQFITYYKGSQTRVVNSFMQGTQTQHVTLSYHCLSLSGLVYNPQCI